jgi:hypothetical protein
MRSDSPKEIFGNVSVVCDGSRFGAAATWEPMEPSTTLFEDDFDLRDTYAAQIASGMRAGWADRAMAAYDHYDEAFKKLCQSNEASLS